VVVGALGVAADARAQSLSELLPHLFRETVVLAPPSTLPHDAQFQPMPDDAIYQAPNQFNAALLTSLATFPLGTSSGSFVYEGDPGLGDFRPLSRTYGPWFAERALTAGEGNFSFGFSFQRADFDGFEGKELDSGDIRFYVRHINVPGTAAFEADLIETSVAMELETSTAAVLLNYGVTDQWDIGAAIPIVQVGLHAEINARIDRVGTASMPGVHLFPDGSDHRIEQMRGSATGLGDIVLRTKYRFLKTRGGGLAAALDLRVPTGNEEDLLGLGATQAKMLFIGSREMGRFVPHVNLSYAFTGDSDLPDVSTPDEFGYVFGVETTAGRATILADVIGRTLFDTGRFEDQLRTFAGPTRATTVARQEFSRRDGSLSQVIGVVGLKYPLADRFLVSFNALFSLNDAGLRERFMPVFGIEYALPPF
jgi:Putative MetA-pathway of phenol degradation